MMNKEIKTTSIYKRITQPVTILGLGSLLCLSACTKNFKDYNTDANKIDNSVLTNDHLDQTLFFTQMEKNVIPAGNDATNEINQYQLAENLQGDLWSGMFGTPTNFGGGLFNGTYYLNNGWANAALSAFTKGVVGGWTKFKENADKKPEDALLKGYLAIADIIKVFAASRTTDMYGPIPYSKFGIENFATPYDPQDQIYNALFSDLDKDIEALELYVKAFPQSPLIQTELVYKGDALKWLKFANSIRLRLATRIVYANEALAKEQFEKAIASPHGLIANNDENAIFNPSSYFNIINPLKYIMTNYGDSRCGATIESYLKGYKDPRLGRMFLPSEATQEFRGIRSGIELSMANSQSDYRKNYSIANIGDNDGITWMSAAEVSFLKSEGATRGWNAGTSAKNAYEEGVKLSFAQWFVSGTDQYLADEKSTQAAYEDVINKDNNVPEGSPLLSKSTIKWNEASTFEQKLERIITQKYIALFPDGQEAWSEFRRTGYPNIFPVVVNKSGGLIDTKVQIRRMIYPKDEYNGNSANVNQAVSYLGGLDNGGTKLWWDKKN